METIGTSIKGIYRDTLITADGRTIHDSGWTSNTIVTSCRVLLTGFMKNDTPKSPQGIQYLAVGQGLSTWDETGTPPPTPNLAKLENQALGDPIWAKDLEMVYLNDKDIIVDEPTNRLQLTATLGVGNPAPLTGFSTYPLREFGLFGTLDGKACMINCVRHPVIHKDTASTLVRVIRLYF